LDDDPFAAVPRWRPAPKPGPRCVTHDRERRAAQKLRAHDRRVEVGFGISSDLYWALYEFQGGRCAIFGCRATGKTKALAVDHDHSCCPGRTSCGKCVRGLLCGPHNEMFGRNGDDPNVFMDMADYLRFPTFLRYHWVQQGRTVPTSRVLRDYAAKQVRDSFALEGRTQREQLDRYSGPGSVEKQLWAVSRNWPDPAAIDTVAGQGIGSAGDEQV
jgi:hypothetical protein